MCVNGEPVLNNNQGTVNNCDHACYINRAAHCVCFWYFCLRRCMTICVSVSFYISSVEQRDNVLSLLPLSSDLRLGSVMWKSIYLLYFDSVAAHPSSWTLWLVELILMCILTLVLMWGLHNIRSIVEEYCHFEPLVYRYCITSTSRFLVFHSQMKSDCCPVCRYLFMTARHKMLHSVLLFRSTPKSRPNNIYMELKCPSVRTYAVAN